MANIIATSGNNQILIDDGDRLYLATDVQVIVDENLAAITGSVADANGHEVTIDGTLVAMGANAIILGDDVNGIGANTLVIGESGIVRSLNYQGNSAIYMIGSSSYLQNWGEVTGTWGSFLQNLDNSLVENHGVMAGSAREGIYLTSSANVQVVNTGIVSGGDGISLISSDGTIKNSGEIIGTGASGYGIDASVSTDDMEILNTGLITTSGTTAIQLGGFDDTVRNSGQIDGDVSFGNGADKYRGQEGTTTGDSSGEAATTISSEVRIATALTVETTTTSCTVVTEKIPCLAEMGTTCSAAEKMTTTSTAAAAKTNSRAAAATTSSWAGRASTLFPGATTTTCCTAAQAKTN